MSERKGTKGLELWCKRLVKDCPNVQIDNMTTSWRNGIAFCALVHHFRPDLIDLSSLKPENIYENNQLAFSIAEKQLGIPALLDPEDMVENEIPDRLSILTYLSQFYRLLGHKVKAKTTETTTESRSLSLTKTEVAAPVQFGKTGLDKCAACGLPVYLAQRLFASHKLYHRSCFRCSHCLGHLNPKTFNVVEGSDFCCDSCKNEKTISKYLNNNDQIGMLAFNDDANKTNTSIRDDIPILSKSKARPQSILEKISIFEKGIQNDKIIDNKLSNLSLRNSDTIQINEMNNGSVYKENKGSQDPQTDITNSDLNPSVIKLQDGDKLTNIGSKDFEINSYNHIPEVIYKSNDKKFDFLQTQLSDSTSDTNSTFLKDEKTENNIKDCYDKIVDVSTIDTDKINDTPSDLIKPQCNITDDSRIANSYNVTSKDSSGPLLNIKEEISISVPPRRKRLQLTKKLTESINTKSELVHKLTINEYPDDLNPFSDDNDEQDEKKLLGETTKKISTNPFGSSDEEEDIVPPIPVSKVPTDQQAPVRRLISANPFWSDGEEPSSDEDTENRSPKMYKSSLTTSTPNLPTNTTRRKKPRAPPPPVVNITPANEHMQPSTSMDDLASISSVSSFNSTTHSDYKSSGKLTPLLKKQIVPTPADSLSTVSGSGSIEKGVDTSDTINNSSETDIGRKVKGPAPGLPLPQRREIKLQLSPEELQLQLDMLETQQLGLERQGVLIEQMIRTKCEGDDAATVPQEEVEDLVIQLCEIVNEKNDLFRKQTELMYIRRQQRLEQEQADIEHEIRIIQSRPAVNRIDADKAREEQLVCRLVEIVRLRDELVQQLDAERQRERREDQAIAASIAHRRAQRNSDSTSCSSMKSLDVVSPKKNKMKDKVKKQLKKAKHSFIPKKKEPSNHDQQNKVERDKKSK